MIPTRLNLLSSQKKQLLRHLISVQFLRHLLELALLLTVLVCTMFLGGEWVLENHFASVGFNHTLVNSGHSKINQEVQQMNKHLKRMNVLQQHSVSSTQTIIEIINHIPDGILLYSTEFGQEKIILSGKAQDRGALLLLRDELTKIPFVKAIEIPLSNLTERKDVEFVLTVTKK